MFLTEEEACKKWCPMVFNAPKDKHEDDYCEASRCMAWRWGENMCGCGCSEEEKRPEKKLGYCGLAGRIA